MGSPLDSGPTESPSMHMPECKYYPAGVDENQYQKSSGWWPITGFNYSNAFRISSSAALSKEDW
jgi:hypothetical protein